jgi:hypothetical protein
MPEFVEKLKNAGLNPEELEKVAELVAEAGGEFPCQSCPSKDDCASFKWFQKWFGAQT